MRCDNCDRNHYCKYIEQFKAKAERCNDLNIKCNLYSDKGTLAKLLHMSEEQFEAIKGGSQ